MPRATIDEVAKAAGVGRSTVSRVLNGSTAVSPSTREAVERAISDLNYVPSPAARSLVMKRAHAVGLIIPEALDRFFGDPFFAEVMTGVTSRLLESEYALNVMVASGPSNEAAANKVTSFILNGGVDGAIVVSHHIDDTFLEPIVHAIPIVFGGRPGRYEGESDIYCVDADNEHGSFLACMHLINTGRRKIAIISGPQNMGASQDRLKGSIEALTQAGVAPVSVIEGDYSARSGAEAAKKLLDDGADIDGIFAANDIMAAAVVRVLTEAGLRVPDDVAVVGFDDAAIASEVTPALTTIRQPIRQQGEKMADVLLSILSGENPPPSTILNTSLVVRDSA